MSNKHMKRCSSVVIRKMQLKTTVKYYLTATRMTIIKKKKEPGTSVGEDVENWNRVYCTGNVKWCSHYGKQYDVSSKN